MKLKQTLREKTGNYVCVVLLGIYIVGSVNEIRESIISFNNGVISWNLHKQHK